MKSRDEQRNQPATAGSAASVLSGDEPKSEPRAKSSVRKEIPLVPSGSGTPQEIWDEYFRKHTPEPAAVSDVVLRLHKAKKNDHLIACLEAALVNGQSQPWMYSVLALAMEKAGRPQAEIERVLLSNVDFSAVNITNILYSAAFLTSFGAKERALSMYRQASTVDPTRLEPYVMALKLASEARDPEAVEWAAVGILERAWIKDYEKLHGNALKTAEQMDAALRQQNRIEEANRLSRAIAAAQERDLFIKLSWSGKADLDLFVEDPIGNICSSENPRTPSGGIFIHDGLGSSPKDVFDSYICPRGRSGDYRVIVKHVAGEVVGKRAILQVVRYQGTSREIEDQFTVALSEHDQSIRVTLQHGRLKDLAALPLLDTPVVKQGVARRSIVQMLNGSGSESRQAGSEFVASRERQAAGRGAQGGTPGYQPVITILSEGVSSSALAVVSGDRRYVRLTMAPVFSAITGVDTFSFLSGGSNTTTNLGGGTR